MLSLRLFAVASVTVMLSAGSAAAGPWDGIPNQCCCYFTFYDGSGGASECATTCKDATDEVYAELSLYGYDIGDLIGNGEMICYTPGDRPVGLGGRPSGAGQSN